MMKKRILTGLQCTADQFHIGNYFGAVKPLIDLSTQHDADVFLFVANMHSFTSSAMQENAVLRRNALNSVKLYLACLPDNHKFLIYNAADIPAHAQLTWIFSCLTTMGVMERMHAFKDKLQKGSAHDANVGLFTYPILMAADILLYDAQYVPVGQDQKQHVEYARDIASKYNRLYGDTFVIPEPLIQADVAIVPGIDGRKMSKSYNNFIGMLDDEKILLKKVKQIATDMKTVEESKDPDSCNVYNILKLFLNTEENSAIRERYTKGGLSYKEVKDYLYEKLMMFLPPIKERFDAISDDHVRMLLAKNTTLINDIASKKITQVYKHIGFSI